MEQWLLEPDAWLDGRTEDEIEAAIAEATELRLKAETLAEIEHIDNATIVLDNALTTIATAMTAIVETSRADAPPPVTWNGRPPTFRVRVRPPALGRTRTGVLPRMPQATTTTRARERRERHVARKTSSTDSGDDDPPSPPPVDLNRRRRRREIGRGERCALCDDVGSLTIVAAAPDVIRVQCSTCGCECDVAVRA